jgi:hypothetical protein
MEAPMTDDPTLCAWRLAARFPLIRAIQRWLDRLEAPL